MRYKRQEPLRYTFAKPIEGEFSILINKSKDTQQKTTTGKLEVIDLSPSGLRFSTDLELPLKDKEFLVEVSFNFVNEEVKMLGEIVWKKKNLKTFEYGLNGMEEDKKDDQIIAFLKKIHAKSE